MELHTKRVQQETERFGVVAAAIANFSMVEKTRPYKGSDFFDIPDPEPERMTPEQMLAWAKNFAAAQNRIGKKSN